MVTLYPVENVQNCLTHRPPLVVFFLCLLTIASAFIAFAVYVETHAVRDPDVEQDWNDFLQTISKLHFCFSDNETAMEEELSHITTCSIKHHSQANLIDHGHKKVPETNTSSLDSTTVTWTLRVPMMFNVPQNVKVIPSNTGFQTAVCGRAVGLKGLAADELINITVVFLQFKQQCEQSNTCISSEQIDTCITISAPQYVLPKTKLPPLCDTVSGLNSSVPVFLSLPQVAVSQDTMDCYTASYSPNANLTDFLSEAARSLCKVRLMNAGYTLLMLAGVICVFAVVSVHTKKTNHQQRTQLKKVYQTSL
ncbi:transmembrane protein 248-like isoform X2 [Protopterus annectens]|uniref:transmembrane protein 248-like isoform X2 n=1 Tax=Protopterus annectens TaxID=7888 RepID=UPI001CFAFA0B|nr:transmembrane protein 248-like isoform X2 [Protopterus annectens]